MTNYNSSYDGDMTVSIYPGLNIKIPNHQLVVPQYDINSKGQTYVSNRTNANVLILSLQEINEDDMPHFGSPFLSSAYLFADYDKSTFTLWQSKATTDTNIVAIGPPTCDPPPPSATVSDEVATAAPTGPPPSTSGGDSGVSKGVIAGSVVGGLAAIALGLCVLWVLARRKRHGKSLDEPQFAEPMEPFKQNPEHLYDKAEMPSDNIPPQEMPLSQDPTGVLAPYEVSGYNAPQELPCRRETRPWDEPYELPVPPKTPKKPGR